MTEPNGRLPLFKHFPGLEKSLARVPLANLPTPVVPATNTGYDNLWIKRDDLTSPIYGGNKVRKLEFILGDVELQKKKNIVTFGGLGTNHGLATAVFCRRIGGHCTLLLFDQPITGHVRRNLLLFYRYGADVIYKGSFLRTALAYFIFYRVRRPRDYFLYPGGSSPVGTIGYVNAAFELKEQIDRGLLPAPAVVFCPLGSGGTLAGLTLGCALAGIHTTVIGVRVTMSHLGPFHVCTAKTVFTLMRKTYRRLRRLDPRLPAVSLPAPSVAGDYLGDGYGYPTDAGRRAYDEMKSKEGILLDPCYTAKTAAAVFDHLASADRSAPVLYWHTYNSVDLSDDARAVDKSRLPPVIRALAEGVGEGCDFPA